MLHVLICSLRVLDEVAQFRGTITMTKYTVTPFVRALSTDNQFSSHAPEFTRTGAMVAFFSLSWSNIEIGSTTTYQCLSSTAYAYQVQLCRHRPCFDNKVLIVPQPWGPGKLGNRSVSSQSSWIFSLIGRSTLRTGKQN